MLRNNPSRTTTLTWAAAALVLLISAPTLATTLSISPPDTAFADAEQVQVQVVVDEVSDLLAFTLEVTYDPAVVVPVAVQAGDFVADAPCFVFLDIGPFASTPGMVTVDAALLGCTLTGGGGLLAITFEGVSAGTSPVVIASSFLSDSQAEPIEVEVVDGTLTYQSGAVAHLAFDPAAASIDPSGTCEVCLTLSDVIDFVGLSVEFGFDPSVVVPVGMTPGSALIGAGCDFFLEWVNVDSFTSTMAIDAALLGCHVPMDGPIVCVTFEGVNGGESPLTWLEAEVRDGDNVSVPLETADGSIQFDEAVAVNSRTLSEVKGYFAD